MKTIFDLAKISTEQLCEMFNDLDNVVEEKDISSSDIINEFINRKISTVNIQRAVGSMAGNKMRIWYNRSKNCIEVCGRNFFDNTDLLQW